MTGSLNQNIVADNMQASIQDVKNRHQLQLMSIPGVVSVGIGLDENKNQVIIIGLEADDQKLKSSLPPQLEGYRVIVQHVGKMKAQ